MRVVTPKGRVHVVMTSLLDPVAFPVAVFADLYHGRWRIEEAWWDYHPDRFREEIALARTAHANCIRLWIEYSAWMADPDKLSGFSANYQTLKRAVEEYGISMIALFDNIKIQPVADLAALQKRLYYPLQTVFSRPVLDFCRAHRQCRHVCHPEKIRPVFRG